MRSTRRPLPLREAQIAYAASRAALVAAGGVPGPAPGSESELSEAGVEKETELFDVETTEAVTFNGAAGSTLKLRLSVWTKGTPAFRTLMGYYGYIYFQLDPSQPWEDIGKIDAYGISRPTVRNPHIDPRPWIAEWLDGKAEEKVKYTNDTLDIANALRAIYQDTSTAAAANAAAGAVKARVAAQYRLQLASDGTGHDIVYIKTLWVHEQRPDDVPQPGVTVGP